MGARADWERRIGRRGVPGLGDGAGSLPRPGGLRRRRAGGTSRWTGIRYRGRPGTSSTAPTGRSGGAVRAAGSRRRTWTCSRSRPGRTPITSGEPGRVRVLRGGVGGRRGVHRSLMSRRRSRRHRPRREPAGPGRVRVEIGGSAVGELERPWEPMIGSEHLSYLLREDRPGGRGDRHRAAGGAAGSPVTSSACGAVLGAHGILCDDLGAATKLNRSAARFTPSMGWTMRGRHAHGEVCHQAARASILSFLPAALARDPSKTVFDLRGDHLPAAELEPVAGPGPGAGRPPPPPAIRHGGGGHGTLRVRGCGTSRTSGVFWSGTPLS